MADYTEILMKISGDVGEMKGIVTSIDKKLDAHINDDSAVHKSHGTRIQKLETARAISIARAAILISICSILGGAIASMIVRLAEAASMVSQ